MPAPVSRSRTGHSRKRESGGRRQARSKPPLLPLLWAFCGWAAVLVMLQARRNVPYAHLTPGQRSPITVVSSVEFKCPDTARTELLRHEAARNVPPVFILDRVPLQRHLGTLEKVFRRLKSLRTRNGRNRKAVEKGLADMLDLLEIHIQPGDFMRLAPPGREDDVLAAIRAALDKVWSAGIVTTTEKESGFRGLAADGGIALHDTAASNALKVVAVTNVYDVPSALAAAVNETRRNISGRARIATDTLQTLLEPWIEPNLRYDAAATETMRRRALESVQPVVSTILPGTTLVEAGRPITAGDLEKLRRHARRLRTLQTPSERALKSIGQASVLFLVLIICTALLQLWRPQLLRDSRRILLLMVISLVCLLAVQGLVHISGRVAWLPPFLSWHLFPLALAPLLATILIDSAAASVLGIWISFAAALISGGGLAVLVTGMLSSVVAAHSAREVHRRSRIFRVGLWIAAAQVLGAVAFGLMEQRTAVVLLWQCAAGIVNGVATAFLALLLIPLFELLFRVTTDITLLELSDISHPLLQRLAMEAPGTYHHSLMVANLAAAAAQRIGANALLVRVCAYFHDIGKLTKPEFFSENMQLRHNPHDDLSPNMSALVIASHVKEGLTLAARYKLPRVIWDAIEQHHGTSMISFFYQRARQRREAEESSGRPGNGSSVDPQDFRYPGPKPASREMGILALADAVEAASRSLDKPTASRIENLVNEIVNARLLDGQLATCDLTIRDIAQIRESFIFTLTNMLHGRIAYPQDENGDKRPATKTSPGTPESRAPAAPSDATAPGT